MPDLMHYDLYPFPPERAIVGDAGYLGTGRHITHALVELDMTRARELLRAVSAAQGRALSFTAFPAASLARAVKGALALEPEQAEQSGEVA